MSRYSRNELGQIGEDFAVEHYERLGYYVVTRNYRTRYGELDLVVADGTTLAFCEVRSRRSGVGMPWESIDRHKQRRVRKMVSSWLASSEDRPPCRDYRCDAIGVTLSPHGSLVRLDHLEGAF